MNFFKESEFYCKCDKCEKKSIHPLLLQKLNSLREKIGIPLLINSGVRCKEHNKRIGSTSDNHTSGCAVDLSCKDLEFLFVLCQEFFSRVGDGRKKGFIHVDIRDLIVYNGILKKKAIWEY